jgi:hypothetical protein
MRIEWGRVGTLIEYAHVYVSEPLSEISAQRWDIQVAEIPEYGCVRYPETECMGSSSVPF